MRKLFVTKNGKDISKEIEDKNAKSDSHGLIRQLEIWHKGKRIGWLEGGYPSDFEKGYEAEVWEVDDKENKIKNLSAEAEELYKELDKELAEPF